MWRGISLANKCLLLFGGAVVLIVVMALSVPWLRMGGLVDAGQLELSRQLVVVWEELEALSRSRQGGDSGGGGGDGGLVGGAAQEGDLFIEHAGIRGRRLTLPEAVAAAGTDRFVAGAVERLDEDPKRLDVQSASGLGTSREYRYAKALRWASGERAGELAGVVLLERRSIGTGWLLAINSVYLVAAGSVVLVLAVLVFYLITHYLILDPVRSLKETAELVREGNLGIRSQITTGDEFEELSETFNGMLTELQRSQEQLRAINAALDLKLNELAETNVALYETAKVKGEFLANVSHELRTPLNSIIGFAELLLEIAHAEVGAGDDSTRLAKRIRYVDNIVQSGRNLLDMINGLLEMAKIEAGKVELRPEAMSVRGVCEALLGLIHPLAERKGIELKLEVGEDVPVIETDVKRFQQVIFNFLSNAVKFTAPGPGAGGGKHSRAGRVTLRAERLVGRGSEGRGADERVRVSVIDTGPGIAPEDQEKIFDKFQQLDGSHTREHAGTGLGLAISKELAGLLQGELQLVSEVGRGSMFSLMLPLRIDPERAAEIKLESAFRGALRGRKVAG